MSEKVCPNCSEELDDEMIASGVCEHCGAAFEKWELDGEESDQDDEDKEDKDEEDDEEDEEEDEEEDGDEEDDDKPPKKKGDRK